jgi:hypothetical protein
MPKRIIGGVPGCAVVMSAFLSADLVESFSAGHSRVGIKDNVMARSSQPRSVRGFQEALSHDGEVRVGAASRRADRQRWLMILAGVALVGIAAGVYGFIAGLHTTPVEPARIALGCVGCGEIATMTPDPQRSFPATCPSCEKKALWPLWQCRDDGTVFLPGGGQRFVTCPQCGGQNVGDVTRLDESIAKDFSARHKAERNNGR